MSQVFKNLGKFISYESRTVKTGMPELIVVKYTQPQYKEPNKEWSLGIFEDKASEELVARIVKLKPGEEITVHSIKNDKGFGELVDITDAKDAPKPMPSKTTYKKGGNSTWQPKDETGIAVGAAWTNALELTKQLADHVVSVDAVEALAWDILTRKLAQEDRLRAYKTTKQEAKAETVEKKEEAKPLSKIEAAKRKASATKAPAKTVLDEIADDEPNFDDEDIAY